jgi:hypothetical protein
LSDLIAEGVIRKTGSAPFPDTSAPPPPAESDAPDVVRSRIDRPIERETDEENVREATRQMREWEQGVGGDDPFAEQRAPVLERKYDGRDKSSRTLRQASTEVSLAKTLERPDVQFAKATQGLTDQQVLAAAKDPEWIKANTGWTRQEADEFVRTGQTPAVPIVPFDERRGFMDQLRDHEPVLGRPAHEAMTLKEATRQSKNAREVVELTRQELAKQEAEALALQQQQAKPQEAAQPAPQAQPTPAPQQPPPDPLAAEKQRLAFEAQALTALKQASVEEMRAMASAEQIVAVFPELKSEAAIRDLYARNPQRFQQLQAAAQQLQNCQAQFQRANEARAIREAQLQQAEAAHVNAVYRQYSKANDDAFTARTPEMNDPAKALELRTATRKMMADVGFSEDEIQRAWAGQVGVPLRDYRVQQLLADGARWRMAKAKARNVTKASVPPVQRPGVVRPRGADSEGDIGRLERELATSTGDRAIKLGTKLHQARRRAGML